MKFLKKFAKQSNFFYSLLCLFCQNTLAESIFYTPTEEVKKKYEINHKSFLETAYGGTHTIHGKNLHSFNKFQNGRLNARSIINISDLENQYSATFDVQTGTDVKEDRSDMFYVNQGYIEMKNANQPIKTKLKFGIQTTANTNLAVNSGTVMKNNQGLNGNWYRFIQMPVVNQNGGYNPTFVLNSMPLSHQGFTDSTFLYSKNNNNLNFVQPSLVWSNANFGLGLATERKNGLLFSLSYQPSQNSGNFGISGNGGYDRRGIEIQSRGNAMFAQNLTSVVLNYLEEFNGVAVNASLGYEYANFRTNKSIVDIERHSLSQYMAGLNLSYLGVTVGGSYSNAGKSLLLKPNANQLQSFSTKNSHLISASSGQDLLLISQNSSLLSFDDTYNFDAGISYSIANFQAGIAHAKSHFAGNRFSSTIFSLSEDMKSTERLKFTAIYELGFYQFLSADYFSQNGASLEVKKVPKMSGVVGSIGLRIYI